MAKTLIEAMALVVVVMFVFLQNWRATLFPTIAVPVVVLGTFGVLKAFGYSINTLTLFALVLVIGLLVDDAIVVVENVERIMTEEGLSPKEATKKSMDEITGALFGIAMVLTAVLAPMGFFGGSTGVIYRQFSVTMVSAILLSVLVALVLTPALTATLLKPHKPGRDPNKGLFGGFNRVFDSGVTRYERGLQGIIKRPWPLLALYGVILAAMVALFIRLPSGFLPDEDQGAILAQITLPVGAVATRTVEVQKKIEHQFLVNEKDNVEQFLTIQGFSFAGVGQNTGIAFAKLKDWDIRKGAARHAPAIAQRANRALSAVRDAQIFALVQPAVSELGNATGFDMELEDRGGLGHDRFLAARNQLLGMASQDPGLVAVRPNGQEDTPQFHVEVDNQKAGALGLAQADINTTLSGAWGGIYVNDFIDRDRVKHVYIQGDAPFRSKPEDLNAWRGAQQHRHHDAVLGLLLDRVDLRSLPAYPLQRPARLRNPGPAGAGPELGFGDRQDGGHGGQAAGRRRLRVDGPVLPGAGVRIAGAPALRHLDPGGVPVPGGPLRKLVDPDRGAVRAAAGDRRRPDRGQPARPLQRHLFPGRPAHHHGPGGQERHPDRRIRRRRPEARRGPDQGRHQRVQAAPSPDPDDLPGLHGRGHAAGPFQRRRRRQPERHRHRRDRRHAVRHRAGHLLRAAELRPGAEVLPARGAAAGPPEAAPPPAAEAHP